eukprot:4599869-Amphidinium_carterae.1
MKKYLEAGGQYGKGLENSYLCQRVPVPAKAACKRTLEAFGWQHVCLRSVSDKVLGPGQDIHLSSKTWRNKHFMDHQTSQDIPCPGTGQDIHLPQVGIYIYIGRTRSGYTSTGT